MASLQDYFSTLSTEELSYLLYREASGHLDISPETIIVICDILAQRQPPIMSAKESWQNFAKNIFPTNKDLCTKRMQRS